MGSAASWLRRGALALAVCVFGYTLVTASPHLDRTQTLAQERYGASAAETVAAWRALMAEHSNATDLDKLRVVNDFFNRRIIYELDPVVWKENDYWATPLEFMGRGTGDCEDYSIAKYMTLLLMGVPNEKLRLIYVRARTVGAKTEAHMVLGYYPEPAAEPQILDNLITSVRPASRRSDLSPVFSFNSEGLWVAGAAQPSADPTARLSRWRGVLDRMKEEGL
ncbi:MAG: transglutaminase-like cysteine peptidase [Serpentinimonas sp.]|jgi:predicted transglutaminase-like cysteine proteinase|nr:transglutaminase-like cysteine peptidase [Serpentinimonas sp.]